jgi:hypothetical protein
MVFLAIIQETSAARINPNVVKAGGLQIQGAKGEVVAKKLMISLIDTNFILRSWFLTSDY